MDNRPAVKHEATSVQRFDDWYTPHIVAVLSDWRKRHPIKHHCEPLATELHTNLPITVKEYDWF